MASLVTCKVCKKEHSDDVKRCPHCGAKYSPSVKNGAVAIVLLVISAMILIKCSEDTKKAQKSVPVEAVIPPAPKPFDENEAKIDAGIGCELVAEKAMKDPSSFNIDRDATRASYKDGKGMVTIYYRAKNSFGAITPGAMQCKFEVTTGTNTRIVSAKELKR